jgi:hypothetical protein
VLANSGISSSSRQTGRIVSESGRALAPLHFNGAGLEVVPQLIQLARADRQLFGEKMLFFCQFLLRFGVFQTGVSPLEQNLGGSCGCRILNAHAAVISSNH